MGNQEKKKNVLFNIKTHSSTSRADIIYLFQWTLYWIQYYEEEKKSQWICMLYIYHRFMDYPFVPE
jgi:hypothetical protein